MERPGGTDSEGDWRAPDGEGRESQAGREGARGETAHHHHHHHHHHHTPPPPPCATHHVAMQWTQSRHFTSISLWTSLITEKGKPPKLRMIGKQTGRPGGKNKTKLALDEKINENNVEINHSKMIK